METEDWTIAHQHATITALRDRVAEVERERDAALCGMGEYLRVRAEAEAAAARATAAEAAIARLRDEVAEALRGLTEEYAALAEGRKSRYVSPNGICAYDNAIAALRALNRDTHHETR